MMRRWRRYLALLMGVLFFCISIPSFAQTGGCPRGYVPYYQGINNTCIPDSSRMTVRDLLLGDPSPENLLPAELIRTTYNVAGIQEPVPPGGGNLGSLPLGLLFGSDSPSEPPQIQANLGEITAGAGLDPNQTRASDIPFLNKYLPGSQLSELFLAYQRSGVPFANKRVDEVPPVRDKLRDLMGSRNYAESGVGQVALNSVLSHARNGVGVAIQALRNALERQVGSLINARISELGLNQLFPENFSFFPKALLNDLWGLPIPWAKIKQVLDFPIPVPVELANTGTGNIQQTLGGLNQMLNAISGFVCPDGGRGGQVDDTSQGRREGNDARMQLFGNRSTYFRVGGISTQCGDPSARGLLGALTSFQGRQVVKAWTVTTSGAKIDFQLGLHISVQGIQYRGRMRICFTKKPWSDILGCSANGALAGGFSLPSIPLNKTGIIFMPLRDFIQSFLSNPAFSISHTDTTKILGYLLNFISRRDLLTYLPDSLKPLVPAQPSQEMLPPG